jgi:excisionase family DNA binding protein
MLEYNPSWSGVMPDDWITTTEAAELSGYHPERIRELIRDGRIEARKFGTIWQVSQSSLLTYLKAAEKTDDKRWGPKNVR